MRRIVIWLNRQPIGIRLLLSSVATAAPFYAAALLSYEVAAIAAYSRPRAVALHAVVFTVLCTVVVFVHRYISFVVEEARRRPETFRKAIANAYTLTDRAVTRDIERLCSHESSLDIAHTAAYHLKHIEDLVSAGYNTFENV